MEKWKLFSKTHRTFIKTDHTWGHTTSLNMFADQNLQSIFSDHSEPKLDMRQRAAQREKENEGIKKKKTTNFQLLGNEGIHI